MGKMRLWEVKCFLPSIFSSRVLFLICNVLWLLWLYQSLLPISQARCSWALSSCGCLLPMWGPYRLQGNSAREESVSIFWLGEKTEEHFLLFLFICHFFPPPRWIEMKVLHDFLCPSKCLVFMWSMVQTNINCSYNFISFPSSWNFKNVT